VALASYLVILKDHEGDPGADVNGDFDITSRVNVAEVVDGAPIRAMLTLDARAGRFITKTPKIKKWDRIYIEVTDKNSNQFKTVVHVKKIKKFRKGNGAQLKLVCPHQSSNLLSRTISKPNRRTSGLEAVTDAINQLNDPQNKGTKDPTVVIKTPFEVATKNGIRLDDATSNNYTYESITFGKAMEIALTKESAPVEAGGSFQWHYYRFVSLYAHPNDADLDKVAIQVFEQGFHDNGGFNSTPTITIKKNAIDSPPSNLIDTDSSLEPEQATNLIAIGSKSSGTYLKDTSKFFGAKQYFLSARLYDATKTYVKGQLVTSGGVTYESIGAVPLSTPPPNALYWTARTFTKPATYNGATTYAINDLVNYNGNAWKSLGGGNLGNQPDISPDDWIEVFFVPGVDYSPLTKDKAQYWVNAMAGWSFAGTADSDKTAVVDPNVIIKDDLHPRTWVDCVEVDSTLITSSILNSGQPYDTLRVLVNGTGLNDFAGNDPNGVSKSNAVLEYRGTPGSGGAWYVLYSAPQDQEVVDMELGDSWTYKPCEGALSFVDVNGVCQVGTRNPGWVKGAYAILDIGGLLLGHFTSGLSFECLHTVKRTNPNVEVGNESITDEDGNATSAVFVNFTPTGASPSDNKPSAFFAGMNFAFPWPRNSNAVPFGAVTIGEKIKISQFDLDNMHLTSQELREWFGEAVEEFLPIQGFRFWHLIQEFFTGGILNPTGDYSMGLWLADRSDNVGVIEYTHQRNNDVSPAEAPIGKLTVYRGVPGVANFSPARKVESFGIVDTKSIVRGGIYTKDSFDKDGRYLASFANLNGAFTRFGQSEKIHLAVDAFAMSKPLVATNIRGTKPERNIETSKIKAEQIIYYPQLVNFVKSMETVLTFERQEWPLKTALRCDLAFGDPLYYEDAELIDETTDAKPNTLKVVADEITYNFSKTAQGPGGGTRSIKAKTRIWP